MAYKIFLDNLCLPVAPEKIDFKINNQNKTMNLINNGEINILKNAGLTDIDFEVLLPNVKYPFAIYDNGFQNSAFYLAKIETLKLSNRPFQFEIFRQFPNGKILFDNSMLVSLESYSIIDDVKDGFDIRVSISLKEYRHFFTQTPEITYNSETQTLIETSAREESTSPKPTKIAKSHTVVSGNSLWAIAKKYYGDGSRYPEIYSENKELIDKRNKGTGNDKYTIYPNQVFVIPV